MPLRDGARLCIPRSIQLFRCRGLDFGGTAAAASPSSGDMADGAEHDALLGVRHPTVGAAGDKPGAARPEAASVMSRQPHRHQPSAASAASKASGPSVASKDAKSAKGGNKDTKATSPTTPVSLDPIHRQKIQELRLRAAQATLKRQGSLRRKFFTTSLVSMSCTFFLCR